MYRLPLLFLVFAGCMSSQVVHYEATRYQQTVQEAAIYSDTSAIPYEFFIIGEIRVHGGSIRSYDEFMQKLKRDAALNGADAVIDPQGLERYYNLPAVRAKMIRFKRDTVGQLIARLRQH